jgi:hypothetical protein
LLLRRTSLLSLMLGRLPLLRGVLRLGLPVLLGRAGLLRLSLGHLPGLRLPLLSRVLRLSVLGGVLRLSLLGGVLRLPLLCRALRLLLVRPRRGLSLLTVLGCLA